MENNTNPQPKSLDYYRMLARFAVELRTPEGLEAFQRGVAEMEKLRIKRIRGYYKNRIRLTEEAKSALNARFGTPPMPSDVPMNAKKESDTVEVFDETGEDQNNGND